MTKTYHELSLLPSFEDRLQYLMLGGIVGKETFGFERYLNQRFYKSAEWRNIRNYVISRDYGCDLAFAGRDIYGPITIHHMNPIETTDIVDATEYLLNPDYLICVSHDTHNAIHYGDSNLVLRVPLERKPNDTCPWK